MSEQLKIYCKNLSRYVDICGGESLSEIVDRLRPELGFEPICAYVNNKNEGLAFKVYNPKIVEFLPLGQGPAERVYVRSLCMMLYKAVHDLLPGVRLRIEHSVSHGYYCRLSGLDKPVDTELAQRLEQHMRATVAADLPFTRMERLTEHAIDMFREQGLDDKARLLGTLHELYTVYYRLGDLSDSYYGCLAPRTGMLGVFGLRTYRDGLLLTAPDPDNHDIPRTPVEQNKMFNAFLDYLMFNRIVGVSDAGELNMATAAGESPMLINVSEALHVKRISTIADDITRRFREGGAKIVMVAGPSSSGKTTFTKRLGIMLTTNLLRPKMISLDDYFVNRDATPLDEYGERDYESVYALDLKLFNEHLNRLINGEEVELPYYNFETGQREFRGNRIRLEPDSVLLIEGIHGLNPVLTEQVDDRMKYKIYISALTAINIDDHNWIPTTDNRLLRRIIRDDRYRGVSATETIRRWPSVRRGEEKWIFPFQENADATFNSSLLFELAVLRPRAEAILRQVPHDVPEYAEAQRLRTFISYFTPISEQFIPSTSLLREFLGGSSFRY